jgi:hypothetical protein
MVVAPFAASPGFALLDNHASLRLVTDAVHEDDALALALACSPLRDALFARFPRLPADHAHGGQRIRTRDAAVVATAGRLAWVLEMEMGLGEGWRPAWLERGLTDEVAIRVAYLGGLAALQWVWQLRQREPALWLHEPHCAGAVCISAARGGQLDVLLWARENGFDWAGETTSPSGTTCAAAARGGHLGVLKWARENGSEWTESTCSGAARGGHLGVLRWAKEQGCPWDWQTVVAAAEGGHLEVLMWVYSVPIGSFGPWSGIPAPNTLFRQHAACFAAAGGGHLAVLQWGRARDARYGHQEFMWNTRTSWAAARGGHLEVLQWARENGCPWDTTCCLGAARGGHLRVLQWARENGCAWGKATCSSAARGGHLGVLQWARENGCAWGEKTCLAAAVGGHLEVLLWARENGCAWDFVECLEAAIGGDPAVFKWIVDSDPVAAGRVLGIEWPDS